MAGIRRRNGKWQVQIRRANQPSLSKSFIQKSHAERWARKIEAQLDVDGLLPDTNMLRQHTLKDLIDNYLEKVTPKKRGHGPESLRLKKIARHPLASCRLQDLNPASINRYVDERVGVVCSATVSLEIGLLHHIIETAKLQWNFPFKDNPVRHVQRPGKPAVRNRRLEAGEEQQLFAGCKRANPAYLKPIITLALETAMRRGEILSIEYDNINQVQRTLKIPVTKNGHPRTIPLSSLALSTLQETHDGSSDRIFQATPNAFRLAWEKLRRRVGIEDLHFHDLRHEAISRLFEKGLSIPEVALISGHRDYRMLFRYTHLRAEDVAKKLD